MPSDSKQQQFLNVIDRDEAERRWRDAFSIADGCETEVVDLQEARGRVLADPVVAPVDVPGFDRSNLDGFAVRAADTWGASEEHPVRLQLVDEVIATAVVPQSMIESGFAAAIATGGMLPRGADAIVMVEHTDAQEAELSVYKSVSPGQGLTFAGTDIARGETLYRPGEVLTSRETGVLAAIGVHRVPVFRRPRVGILSTGDEIISPGEAMRPGLVYDSNAQVLADAVVELGGEARRYGIVHDDLARLREKVQRAVAECEIVLLSGGTSKGAGDLSYRVLAEWSDPGIVAHGVALKPGKPICLAVTQGKPVVILPGFPTSAIFTFHEFVADVIAQMAGRAAQTRATTSAVLATQVNSEIGRTEYLLVGLVHQDLHAEVRDTPGREANDTLPSKASSSLSHDIGFAAYPMGKGSGSVTTFARADGFVTIDRHTEIVEHGATVEVKLLGQGLQAADLVVLGSHCVGLDFLLGELQRRGMRSKFMAIGSTAGLRAVDRGNAIWPEFICWTPRRGSTTNRSCRITWN